MLNNDNDNYNSSGVNYRCKTTHVSQLKNVLILTDDLPRSGLVHFLPFLNSFSLKRNKHKAQDVYDNVLFF